ncbi:RsmB/NOP family class I SAM-dependent RNA methyltransferase [Actomonas aquatica]|uniref:RsmB/NOP family class I SAM-dependent RNA methyltransferase n=1 Tax=Actomonas aquatica TaxID=2866162 RepID=A0ABZ1CCQ9_9BACT|nr:RsmB/NOP family class I SAM-dependent RNA methyltransferase [Opitutus sp. WL0086]WRQ89459.1 RsmB/NOP family class I SAM-dependent RNA methyltransferase [Opitutus sp. WL0086]
MARSPHIDGTAQRAAQILSRAKPGQRIDTLLRETFAHQRRLAPAEKTAIAGALFATARWHRWLDPKAALPVRVAAAMHLQARFEADPTSVKPEALAALALPDWVRDEVDLSPADLIALQTPPPLWIRTRAAYTKRIKRFLTAVTPAPAPANRTGLLYSGDKDLFRTEPFHQGHLEIQDLGSQLVGHACVPQPGETWWDTCAGEGGKTLHLAELLEGKGLIWATDRHTGRLQKLKQRASRAKVFNYRSTTWDGGAKLPTKTLFDGILIDAPCSGIGTWRRNPHARWTTTLTDVQELAVVQRQLLEHALPALKPGGRLIYAVCTLAKSETTAIADAFTAAHPELQPLALLNRGPQVTLSLSEWNANGMFLAGWTRPTAS